jgi:hypothetical protein
MDNYAVTLTEKIQNNVERGIKERTKKKLENIMNTEKKEIKEKRKRN